MSRNVICETPHLTRRSIPAGQSRAGLSVESIILSLGSAHDRELLSRSLFLKIRSASGIDYGGWSPAEFTVLPMFPLPNLPSAPVLMPGGDVCAGETEVGYWPVFPRMALNTLVDGRSPHDFCDSLSFTLPLYVKMDSTYFPCKL